MQKNTTLNGAAAAAILSLGLVAAGCGGSGKSSAPTTSDVASAQKTNSTSLVGAGSTLVAPLVAQWQSPFQNLSGVGVTYGAIGSGGGIQQITSRTVDFGASDAPLSSDQAKACHGCVQIPWALAATTLSYNVPGVSKPLRLTGPVIAGMFLGRIKTWNDPSIRKLNPGANLPSTAVTPVYRSDASGDTYAFTDYLSQVSPAWRSKVGGASTSANWPTGTGATKNSGVAAVIERTPGSIGYTAIGEAVGDKLHYALVQNRGRAFVKPSTQTIAAAAQTAQFKKDGSASVVDPPASAKNAYPISTFTYVIVPASPPQKSLLKQWILFALGTGQKYASALDFAPLPAAIVAQSKIAVNRLS
jgi:phosphate transport system substrate-binding protein